MAVPAAVAVGVLRYRLLGVEVVIRRTLQFAVLTLLVVVVYAAVTAAMSALVSDETGSRVVAAAAVALVLLPLRDRLQTWVDRLVYGARRDPLGAIRQVGVSVSAVTADPLPAVTASVANAVRASYRGDHRRRAGTSWPRPGPIAAARGWPIRSPWPASRSASW